MKKYFKYFLYGIIYILLVLLFAIMFIVTTRADVIKPNNGIDPVDVIKIQLNSLKDNNIPYDDAGIKQTWEFAHPNNRKFTGPLENFTNMMYSRAYIVMINHSSHNITKVSQKENIAFFFIELTDKLGNKFGFTWTVQKVLNNTDFKNCWMTTGVSQPISLAKSA